jgi:hypothetical protein
MRRVALILLLAPIAILGACASEEVNTEPDAAPVTVTETVEAGGEPTTNATEETTTEETSATEETATLETPGQENARRAAESYLETAPFSRKGLIGQLKFEGYSTKDATYAVDAVRANWKEQAAKAAQSYLETSPFSRSGLIEQLEFEGYTPAEARYGVDKVGL